MANELYRQTMHIICGVGAALSALFLSKTVFLSSWGFVFLATLALVVYTPSSLTWIWTIFERKDVAFKGKGALFFIGGIWLTGALFWEQAFGALLLLAIPDALATIGAPYYHSVRLPWNHRKSAFGSSIFFVSALAVLFVFVPVGGAFLTALLLTAIESFDYREIPFLDDNVVIPLVAGFLLQFA